MTLFEVAQELSRRLASTFLRDGDGRRPVYGGTKLFQDDPHWRDHILFYEYFHGDNGAGLGASHQTGWTGLVARMIQSIGPVRRRQRARGPPMADGPAVPAPGRRAHARRDRRPRSPRRARRAITSLTARRLSAHG